jgi:hypothetical protein
VRTLAIVSSLVLVAGCKGKPKHEAPPVAEQPTGSGSGTPVADKPAPAIELPKGTGGPPAKTTKPLDDAVFQKLVKLTYPGFQLDVHARTTDALEIRQKTEDHPKIWATISLAPCKNDCTPMDLAKWKEKEDMLKQFLSDDLKKAPDTVFEVGNTNLNGQDMIYTYQLGEVVTATSGTYSDAYTLYYNDGVNQARVVAEYKDDPTKTKDDMAKLAPKADLESVAKAFMDVYTQAWASP